MLRVKLSRERTGLGGGEQLGELRIINDGTGSTTVGHYNFELYSKDGRLIHTGRVLGFPRKQQGAFRLLARVMQQVYPSQQPGRRRRRWAREQTASRASVKP